MSLDPRRLLMVIGDLSATMRSWNTLFAEVEENLRRASNEAVYVAAELNLIAWQTHQAADDMHRDMRQAVERVADARAAALAANSHANSAVVSSENTATAASARVSEWHGGLVRADKRLSAALHALAVAETTLQAARSALLHAQNAHGHAVAAYNSCCNSYTTDNKGNRRYRDCSGEAANVNAAARAVAEATARVSIAVAEVDAAQARVNAARQLVKQCQTGLAAAEALQSRAGTNLQDVRATLDVARDAVATAEIAARHAEEALALATQAVESVEITVQNASRARDAAQGASDRAATVTHAFAEHLQAHASGVAALQQAEDGLQQFDAPYGL